MLRFCKYLKVPARGIISLTERVTVDCQRLQPGVSSHIVAQFERQISRSLNRLTPRQLCICLNGLVRSGVSSRSVLLSIAGELNEALPKLGLRDMAMVVNAFAKMGLRNEIFLSQALPRILRKGKNHPSDVLSPLVLALDAYAKLNVVPFIELVDLVKQNMQSPEVVIKPIDAVAFLRAVARLGSGVNISNDQILMLVESIRSSEDLDLKVSGLCNLGKLKVSYTLCEVLYLDLKPRISELSLFRIIQFLFASNHITKNDDHRFTKVLVDSIAKRIVHEELHLCKDPESAAVLLLSGLTKSSEQIYIQKLDLLISHLQGFLKSPESIATLLNLKATINMPLSQEDRLLVSDILHRRTLIKINSHSFSLLLNALVKLEELELVFDLLALQDLTDRNFLFSISDQAIHTCLLALCCLADHNLPGILRDMCLEWIKKLIELTSRASAPFPEESFTQLRIARAILASKPSLQIMLDISFLHRERINPNFVSPFHREVLKSLEDIHTNRSTTINGTDPETGYEIDILLK